MFSILPVWSFAMKDDSLTVTSLRCEYLDSPLAVDIREPRFSWKVESDHRGARQTAYRIIVSSSEANLAASKGDLWDTGKVASNQTIQITYRGKGLRSRQQCFWKVQSWDQSDKPSSWSKPA